MWRRRWRPWVGLYRNLRRARWREGIKERLLFVNKKKQKNFLNWRAGLGNGPSQKQGPGKQKFFGSFFQKRTAISSPENPHTLGYC
jgi:hypothetical protein